MTAWEFISLILKQAELRKSQRFVETQARLVRGIKPYPMTAALLANL